MLLYDRSRLLQADAELPYSLSCYYDEIRETIDRLFQHILRIGALAGRWSAASQCSRHSTLGWSVFGGGMSSQEVMVVLSDAGKPVTVIRALDDDDDVISRGQRSPSSTGARVPADARSSTTSRLDKEDRSKGKDFEEQIELRRLRAENSLLLQRIDHLEKQQHQQQQQAGDCQVDGDGRRRSSDAVSSAGVTEDDRSPEIQRLHDELVASKLREAEAHLTMKEFEQKLLQLQRNWQCFVDDSQSASGSKTSSAHAQLRDTVMALRLREASLVSDMNALKRRLIELETQNHVNERKIKRQEVEQANLMEAVADAELKEKELQNSIVELQRKLSNTESKCKEDEVMSRIRDAEHSQLVEAMRRRVAELEIENQELTTAAELRSRDGDIADSSGHRITSPLDEESFAYGEAYGARVTSPGDVMSSIDQSEVMTSSLLLRPDDVTVTSSYADADVWTSGLQTDSISPPIS